MLTNDFLEQLEAKLKAAYPELTIEELEKYRDLEKQSYGYALLEFKQSLDNLFEEIFRQSRFIEVLYFINNLLIKVTEFLKAKRK